MACLEAQKTFTESNKRTDVPVAVIVATFDLASQKLEEATEYVMTHEVDNQVSRVSRKATSAFKLFTCWHFDTTERRH